MADYMDFFSIYVMGSMQVLTGFYFLTRFLQKKVKLYFYVFFALIWNITINMITADSITEFLIYILLLTISGIFVCHADWKPAVLYSALTAVVMQFSYGIVNSLWGILIPLS